MSNRSKRILTDDGLAALPGPIRSSSTNNEGTTGSLQEKDDNPVPTETGREESLPADRQVQKDPDTSHDGVDQMQAMQCHESKQLALAHATPPTCVARDPSPRVGHKADDDASDDIWNFFGSNESLDDDESSDSTPSIEPAVIPGAFAVRGSDYDEAVGSIDESHDQTTVPGQPNPYASSVQGSFARAIQIDAELAEAEAQRERQRIFEEAVQAEVVETSRPCWKLSGRNRCYLVVLTLILITVGVMVGVLVGTQSKDLSHQELLRASLEEKFGVIQPGSPQERALAWLASNDTLQLSEVLQEDLLKERYVTAVLFFSTGGEDWTNKYGFLEGTPVCSWNNRGDSTGQFMGLLCDTDDFVVDVRLGNNNLTKFLPWEVSTLRALTKLDFDQNRLRGTIHANFGHLSALEELRISENRLTGTVPAEIFHLPSLKVVDLSANSLSGSLPESIGSASVLCDLLLYDNDLSGGLPDSIGLLKEIEVLDLSENSLEGPLPASIRDAIMLRALLLHGNDFSGVLPFSLGSLPALEILDLSSNRFEGPLPSLTNNVNLSSVRLSNNDRINGDLSEFMRGLPSGVSELDLSNTQVTGSLPTSISQCTNLVDVQLDRTEAKGVLPSELGLLVNLEKFSMGSNRLSGFLPPEIATASKLSRLDLRDNKMNGTVPSELASLDNLEEVFLHGNSFEGSLDSIFCYGQSAPQIDALWADCLSEIQCTCCSVCCDSDGKECEVSDEDSALLQTILAQITPQAVLLDESTPQHAAMRWLLDEGVEDLLDNPTRLLQRYTAVTLYYATDGPNWTRQLGFLTDTDECNWNEFDASFDSTFGVVCDDQGQTTALQLSTNNLRGTIPDELTGFPLLSFLSMGLNQLSGTIPSAITELTNLESIRFFDNSLVGTIPQNIGLLNRVTWLALQNNQLSSSIPSSIGQISPLGLLTLYGNRLTGTLPPSLGRLDQITEFLLNTNLLDGNVPSELVGMTSLRTIRLEENGLTGSLEPLCLASTNIDTFQSDCLTVDVPGLPLSPAEVECSCCAVCCSQSNNACLPA